MVQSELIVRVARVEDAALSGKICYEAFASINQAHGFVPDFPSVDVAAGLLSMMFSTPGYYSVVAEAEGRILGSNNIDERAVIHGIGPITVDPAGQNLGVGRRLMDAVMERARQRGAAGVRLVQAAFHNRSLSLYTKLGFDVREPLACMQGPPIHTSIPGCKVRRAVASDLGSCNALSFRVHGFDRGEDLKQSIEAGVASVVEREGRVTGYASQLAFFGHATAETNHDLEALIGAADSFGGPGILVPSRNSGLFRWCLEHGLKVTQPMTLMSVGLYNDPAGAWLPSVLF